jgi:CHAT domain-containing protein
MEFFVGRKIIIAFVISTDHFKAKVLDLKPSDITSLIEASKQPRGAERDKAIADLSSKLTEPLTKDISGAENLILVAGEELRDVPFAALTSDGKPLIDQLNRLTFAPTARFATITKGKNNLDRKDMRLLASLSTDSKDSFFKKERSTITRFFPDAQILDGKAANLASLLGELGQEDILHISAAGVTSILDPMSSYLQLYPSGSETNRLRADEFQVNPTKRRLAILTQTVPSEAITGSFLTQGTRSVVANTGKSDDTSSLFLTKSFYKNYLTGKNPCESLRVAQLSTRRYFPDDLTWANFRIYGACE